MANPRPGKVFDVALFRCRWPPEDSGAEGRQSGFTSLAVRAHSDGSLFANGESPCRPEARVLMLRDFVAAGRPRTLAQTVGEAPSPRLRFGLTRRKLVSPTANSCISPKRQRGVKPPRTSR